MALLPCLLRHLLPDLIILLLIQESLE
jgi:hypothetical protein